MSYLEVLCLGVIGNFVTLLTVALITAIFVMLGYSDVKAIAKYRKIKVKRIPLYISLFTPYFGIYWYIYRLHIITSNKPFEEKIKLLNLELK